MAASTECHITSLVVQTLPEHAEAIAASVNAYPGAEVHRGEPASKFIVLLETQSEQDIIDAINRIQQEHGVLSATMVYHQVDQD